MRHPGHQHVEGGVTKANYRMVWEWVNDHYARLCEVEIDGQCKNATRMSVLCHDPEASSFHTSGMKPREKPKRGTAVTVTAERAYKIIRAQLEEEGIAYAPGSYNDYVAVVSIIPTATVFRRRTPRYGPSGLFPIIRASSCCPS